MIKKILFVYLLSINIIFCEGTQGIEKNKLGIVLSGGGAKGFAHIGVLKVLDEEKVPVDYIVGTSMGSIIGAFYAMGYSGKEIEEIILNKQWIDYFNDFILREEDLIDNKVDRDRYAFSFPMKDWKLELPKGVVKGQNIDNVLSELYLDAKDIDDFSKFPIPFACVATDVETGKEVILNSGYLPDSIRASMSLPSLLSPIEIDNKLLIDGGVVNNFPASVALDMGANYLIGIDIGGRLKKKEEISSFIDIINQTANYKKVEATNEARKKIDLLLLPDMSKYELLSFDKAKEIIAEGEKVAREQLEEIRKFKDEKRFNEIKSKKIQKIDNFFIDDIAINGNKNFDEKTIKKIMDIKVPVEFTREELTELMDKMYNLKFLSKVDYKINGTKLTINVTEVANRDLKLGFNYDNYNKGEFYVKAVRKGLGYSGNKSSVEALVGKNEVIKLENTWYIGALNKFGYSLSTEYSNIEDFSIYYNEQKLLEFNLGILNVNFMLGNFLSNNQMIGLGIKREYFSMESNTLVNMNETSKYKSDYNLIYLKYLYDSLDNKYFPKKGNYMNFEVQYSDKELGDLDFSRYTLKFNKPLKLNNKVVLNTGGEGALIEGKTIAPYYIPRLGGFYNRENSISFWGLETSSQITDKVFSGFGEIFYEFKPSRYLILRYNMAVLNPNEAYDKKFITGGGVGFGVKTPVGPIQLTLATSNKEDVISYLNIGYNF